MSYKVIMLSSLAVSVFAGVLFYFFLQPRIDGFVEIRDTSGRTQRFTLAGCQSGDNFTPTFFGAELDGQGARIQIQAETPALVRAFFWKAPAQAAIMLDAQSCRTWQPHQSWDAMVYSEAATRMISGSLQADCELATGERAVIQATYHHCR